jgi:hypothetical protein
MDIDNQLLLLFLFYNHDTIMMINTMHVQSIHLDTIIYVNHHHYHSLFTCQANTVILSVMVVLQSGHLATAVTLEAQFPHKQR